MRQNWGGGLGLGVCFGKAGQFCRTCNSSEARQQPGQGRRGWPPLLRNCSLALHDRVGVTLQTATKRPSYREYSCHTTENVTQLIFQLLYINGRTRYSLGELDKKSHLSSLVDPTAPHNKGYICTFELLVSKS